MAVSTILSPSRRPSIEISVTSPEWYSDLTGSQRLVALYIYLKAGQILCPSEYAQKMGVSRLAIYRYLRKLSQMGVPVVRAGHARWTLMEYLPKASVFDGLN